MTFFSFSLIVHFNLINTYDFVLFFVYLSLSISNEGIYECSNMFILFDCTEFYYLGSILIVNNLLHIIYQVYNQGAKKKNKYNTIMSFAVLDSMKFH